MAYYRCDENAPVNAFSAESLIEFGAFFRDMAQASHINAVLLSSDLKVFSAGLNFAKEAQLFTIEQNNRDGLNCSTLAGL